ncbi:MAG TPA: DinB family protein [Saprospiraceae bacterium]|nr:DinB family protein [Saprospiraceae bacterium]
MYSISQLLIEQVRVRIFKENIPRIKQCLETLTEAEIWYRPNNNSNAVGNLVLHLCGNARQWIVAGLTDQPDTRDRNYEFEERGPLPTAQLVQLLDQTQEEIEAVLSQLSPADLEREYDVQVFRESGLGILVHVIEHFSYHSGQITYFVKARKNIDTGYYRQLDL